MRDNSEMTNLTKVNTETEFQSKDTFKFESKHVRIFTKLRDVFMNALFLSPDIHHDKLPLDTFWKKTRLFLDEQQENKNISQGLKKSEVIAEGIKKIIEKVNVEYNAFNELTYNKYQDLVKEYCINRKLGENSKTENTLLWVYERYILACIVEKLEDPNYWKSLSPADRRSYLEYGYQLIENREQSTDKYWKVVANTLRNRVKFLYFIKLSITYGIDFNKLLSYDRENLEEYVKKVFSYLDDDTYFFQESQIISYIDPFEPAVSWEDWDVSE